MGSSLNLVDVNKIYPNGKKAVEAATLEIASSEVFGLLGPNGAGKTTMMRMVAGVLRPTSGNIYLGGRDIWNLPGDDLRKIKRMIGYLPEHPVMFQKLTSVEFLTFIGELYALEQSEIQEKTEKYLTMFNLYDRRNEYLEKYSAGMLKKVATVAAILGDPHLVLLDEPFADLDPASIYKLKGLVDELRDEGKAIILSTHFLGIASEMIDKLGIINQGEILFQGTESELHLKLDSADDVNLETSFLLLTGNSAV